MAENSTSEKRPVRRATAESMAASQRDISISEFFAKNRHLLGFDNPRKALLTTLKEAVDNSLDACEEAGILPEIWVRIVETSANHFKVEVQDNGPGILKKQIPNVFGKLLYGSKFHRMRMSRGQQGIGISAAGMYGVLTTGKPVRIVSQTSPRLTHFYEIRINTKKNVPEILNGNGDGLVVPVAREERARFFEENGIDWASEVKTGTRVEIELEAKYLRGRGSVDEYLEQTAVANPHVRLHYQGPEDEEERLYDRATDQLPPEPKEIKPHPYGVELGRLADMARHSQELSMTSFFENHFSKVSAPICKQLCGTAQINLRAHPADLEREEVERLYQAIQTTKIPNPSTDCLSPIGEELLLKGLHQVVPGEFYTAATRPPAVYRGNPFQVEVALAYGGAPVTQNISLELLQELLAETDVRTLRQFLMNTFQGIGADGADKIMKATRLSTRMAPSKMKPKDIAVLYSAMKNVNIAEGQTMSVFRYANRVPLQSQLSACAVTQTIMNMNWRNYGLQQSRGTLPRGPITVMVHLASVWVPFTSESKEAIASYPEIMTEIRLALQTAGRKLGLYLKRKQKVREQADRRQQFLRYLHEVARAIHEINGLDYQEVYDDLLEVAKLKTFEADAKFDESGNRIYEKEEIDYGENVLIVDTSNVESRINRTVRKNSGVVPEEENETGGGAAEIGTELETELEAEMEAEMKMELEAEPAIEPAIEPAVEPEAEGSESVLD
ncbi:MAG: DNA topoisomerase VI subunit B [Thermoguttaceae bacterium]|nr:DNA topoisomerase VI subunit B [Thermoguttaceae bacterium]